ncbi:hypothetical protein BCR33DRAFT_326415 [Rhizoclosmatium globosum]|uniref:PARG catalytic Macro domain-containing protein n=1 Tax=Rhizoclosmatium globosum TaxID=329046 RepID=A0A1Y2C495_9FUNG|nr:hypothetical protein BCR33DRAFT_326415 [Rhizoclosmatium globosum]|eukprot:ORY41858.1 hypothetical protein BCR33DRAFT_326415 [Rhizoclosmatium globosum]
MLNPANDIGTAATDKDGKATSVQRINPIVVDDDHILADLAFNCQALVRQYPLAYKKEPIKKVWLGLIQPRGSDEYDPTDFIRTTRLTPAVLPLHCQIHNSCRDSYTRIITKDDGVLYGTGHKHSGSAVNCFRHDVPEWPEDYDNHIETLLNSGRDKENDFCVPIVTQVHLKDKFSTYQNEHTVQTLSTNPSAYVVEWYVSFTDQGLYQFNDSHNFASEEIKALENPVLGSLRECMYDLSRKGVLYASKNFGRSPLIHDDIHFHLPKHKQKDEFRDSEIDPLSRDLAGLCTPILIQGAPKLATLNPPREKYGKPVTDFATVATAGQVLKSMTTFWPKHDRVKNNFICMSAPDRLANPLRPKMGPYTIYQIRQIFRTAYTAFRGAVLKSKETFECLKEEAKIPVTSGSVTVDFEGTVLDGKVLEVAVHTGDWGTGEFQNNPKVIAYLQIAAAYAAGVDHFYYHTTNTAIVKDAHDWVKEVWNVDAGEQILLEKLLKHLEEKKENWSKKVR